MQGDYRSGGRESIEVGKVDYRSGYGDNIVGTGAIGVDTGRLMEWVQGVYRSGYRETIGVGAGSYSNGCRETIGLGTGRRRSGYRESIGVVRRL